jgi:hypothetical protein
MSFRTHSSGSEVTVRSGFYRRLALHLLWLGVAHWPALSLAETAVASPTSNFGPYNVEFLEGGIGLSRPLAADAGPLAAGAPWSMSGWLRMAHRQSGEVILAAVGDTALGQWRGIALQDGTLSLVAGQSATVRATAALEESRWRCTRQRVHACLPELNSLPRRRHCLRVRTSAAHWRSGRFTPLL